MHLNQGYASRIPRHGANPPGPAPDVLGYCVRPSLSEVSSAVLDWWMDP